MQAVFNIFVKRFSFDYHASTPDKHEHKKHVFLNDHDRTQEELIYQFAHTVNLVPDLFYQSSTLCIPAVRISIGIS